MNNISHNTTNLQASLRYSELGLSVIPVHGLFEGECTCCKDCKKEGKKPGKHPSSAHGVKDASSDKEQIKEFFEHKPWLNVAIALGEEELGLDIDPRHGGDKTLAAWEDANGKLPLTPKVQSGGGGEHYYFTLPQGVRAKNFANEDIGIDTRTAGGYLIAPPSLHESGERYAWLTHPETPMAEAPAWLLDKLREMGALQGQTPCPSPGSDALSSFKVVAQANDFASHPGAAEGSRNQELCRLTGVHLNRGDSLATIEASALAWASRCTPPCEPSGILSKVRSLWDKEQGKRLALGEDSIGEFGEESGAWHGRKLPEPEPSSEHEHGSEGLERELGVKGEVAPLKPLSPEPKPTPEESETFPSMPEPKAPLSNPNSLTLSLPNAQADGYPTLHPDALHGLAGEIVRAIAPETEADPVAVLLSILTGVGNAIGKGPYSRTGAGIHRCNLFTAIVGDTASGKGQSWDIAESLLRACDEQWAEQSIGHGLSSGEGLIDRVRDDDEDEPSVLPEARRFLALETEFVRPITAMRREGNTLSPILRNAWDCKTLEIITRKGKSKLPIRASNHYISAIAHITPSELSKALGNSVEMANGFANRFLWVLARRSNLLPEGGDSSVLEPFIPRLGDAIAKARTIGQMQRDDDAKALWESVYEDLSSAREGAYGSATSRAHPIALRLSMIYALLDGSAIIRVEHLRAALALVRYGLASARLIFGSGEEPEADPLDFRLLEAIRACPGIKRTDLTQAISSALRDGIPDALASLRARGLAHPKLMPTSGRPSECWHPGPEPKPTPEESEFLPSNPGTPQTQEPKPMLLNFTVGATLSEKGEWASEGALERELGVKREVAAEPRPPKPLSTPEESEFLPSNPELSQTPELGPNSLISNEEVKAWAEPKAPRSSPNSPTLSPPIPHAKPEDRAISSSEFFSELDSLESGKTTKLGDEMVPKEIYAQALARVGLNLSSKVESMSLKQRQSLVMAKAHAKHRAREEREHRAWKLRCEEAQERERERLAELRKDEMGYEEFYSLLREELEPLLSA